MILLLSCLAFPRFNKASVNPDLVELEVAQMVKAGVSRPEVHKDDLDTGSRSEPSVSRAASRSSTRALSVIWISRR
jgi:hypothetical protein